MLGKHQYQPELFATIDIEQLIPRTHLLRKIDRVLDLSFMQELAAPLYSQSQGRPSIDPEVFVRMILLEYLYNIKSDRQLCEEISYNLAYRWFCRLSLSDDVADHSSLTRIRDRLGEATYKAIFIRVIEQCKTAGLIKGTCLMADGSLFAANASIYTMKEKGGVEETGDNDDEDGPSPSEHRPSQDGLSNNDLRKYSLSGKKISNDTHFSATDPDSTLAGKAHEQKSLKYKTHHIIDADSRVILDCHVTTGTISESRAFIERLEQTRQRFDLPVEEVVADRGYGTGENLSLLKDLGIESNIALWSSRSGVGFGKETGFLFNAKQISVKCPEGHLMNRKRDDVDSHTFALPKATCMACPRFKNCLSEYEQKPNRRKRVRVHFFQSIYEEVLEKEKRPEFKQKLRERMWKMEGLFAEGKSHHGLRRARYRRRWKVQAQIYMISTVQNLKRLAQALMGDLGPVIFKFFDLLPNLQSPKKPLHYRFASPEI